MNTVSQQTSRNGRQPRRIAVLVPLLIVTLAAVWTTLFTHRRTVARAAECQPMSLAVRIELPWRPVVVTAREDARR
jgi:hypothetical protein